MIAPDEIAPAARKLIERQRRAEAELSRDLGRRIAGAPRRFARRRLRRWRGRVCWFVRPVQSQAEPCLAAGTWRRAKGDAAHAGSSRPARAVVVRSAILPTCLVEGALKGVAAPVGHGRAISTSPSARRGASSARRRLRGFVVWIIGHDAVPSLDLGLVEAFIGASQQVIGRLVSPQLGYPERRSHLADAFATRLNGPLLRLENDPDPLDRGDRLAEAGSREDQRELLAAEAGDLVLAAHVLHQDVSEQPQQVVADQMAETVIDMFEPVDVGKRKANVVTQPSRFLHLLHEVGVEETAIADSSHDVAQSGLFSAFEIRLQVHDLETRLFKLVPDVIEPVAHVAIVFDEGQHDLLDRTRRFVPRQALVVAVEPLGEAFVVGHMGLQHLRHLAQHPVDLFVLVGRVAPRLGSTAALGWTWRGLDCHTSEHDADPAEQQKLQEWSRARNQGAQRVERLVRNKRLQRGQGYSSQEDGGESVNRVDLRSGEPHDFHDRADLVGKSALEKSVARLASTLEQTRRTGSYSAGRIPADL